jgi:aryl-alcohol dehydrogenase-like predicted oxidoreductase
MKYKLFGKRTGLFVSEFALGTGMFGTALGYGAEPDESHKIFNAFADAGGNLIDTSDAYQLGQAEELIGEFIAGQRSHYVVATKYSRGQATRLSPGNVGNHRKALKEAVEASLRRLKSDYIDIYLAHFDDRQTPVEEIVRGLDDLVQNGKILYTGLSNFSAWRTASAATFANITGKTPLTAIQIEYNLLQRSAEQEYWPMANEMGLAVMGYSPMAGGILTSKYRNGEQGRMTIMPGSKADAKNAKQELILDALETIARETGLTSGQVATAWVKSKGVFPIIGARTLKQFTESMTAMSVDLSDANITVLNEASQPDLLYPMNINSNQILTQNEKIELNFNSQLL